MPFNFGDVLERVEARVSPDADALICGHSRRSWADLRQRSNNLARFLLGAGLDSGDKVAFYLRNGNEYSETLAACFKARLTHVNVNYRYLEDELVYLLDNSDAAAVVYATEFRDRIEAVRHRLPEVRLWLEAGEQQPLPDFARSFEEAATNGDGQALKVQRDPDDLLFLYTGGTTGRPKGVMWPHRALLKAGIRSLPHAEATNLDQYGDLVAENQPGRRQLPACPMMHGTGLLTAIGTLMTGGCVVTLPRAGFDPEALLDAVTEERVNSVAIVGDAFCRPMVDALEAHPGRWDLGALEAVVSSGVMWSPEVKQALLQHNDQLLLVDAFGSSEALQLGGSVTSKDEKADSAAFRIGERARVFDDNFDEVLPGSDRIGRIAVTGDLPLGYFKDEEKTARTFPVIGGVRWSMPGDYCRVAADGTLILLGRGSSCINSGGEKIYPEEVEEVLKTHPGVDDALVFGIADDKWGQVVTAVVRPRDAFDEDALKQFARDRLAGYKVPKRIFALADLGRAENGKANYDYVRRHALARIAAESPQQPAP